MIHLPAPACKLIGTAALLGTAVCGKKTYSILAELARKENEEVPRGSKIQRGVTRLLGAPESRLSRISREVFEALSWCVPMMGFIAVACASLEPDGKYIPSELAARLTCLSCKAPRYSDGSLNSDYSIARGVHQAVANTFPGAVDHPAPYWREGRIYWMYYQSTNLVSTVHTLFTSVFPYALLGLITWGIHNQNPVPDRRVVARRPEDRGGNNPELAVNLQKILQAFGEQIETQMTALGQAVNQLSQTVGQRVPQRVPQREPVVPYAHNANVGPGAAQTAPPLRRRAQSRLGQQGGFEDARQRLFTHDPNQQ